MPLKSVPDQYVTQEMCEKAAYHYPGKLAFVPDQHNTLEMCKNAVEKEP